MAGTSDYLALDLGAESGRGLLGRFDGRRLVLEEIHRWSGDDAFVREHWEHALRALEWIEVHADLGGDGWVQYRRRSTHGIENQSWKDSWDSQRYRDGTLATGPIAPAEVQGYAYDARVRMAIENWNVDE